MMRNQWPACWLVRGASRLQRPVRKSVGEVARTPPVRKPVGGVARTPPVREPVEGVAQTPPVREMVGEVARTQSRVHGLALALEALKPRRRRVLGRAWGLSLVRKFVLVPNAA